MFTGLNPEEMNKTMNSLYENFNKIFRMLEEAGKTFSEQMGKIWFSNKAYSFSILYFSRYMDTINIMINSTNILLDRIIESAQVVANANGINHVFPHLRIEEKHDYMSFLKEQNEEGTVGLDIEKIKEVFDHFMTKINFIISNNENTYAISLPIYDERGEIEVLYKQQMTSYGEMMRNMQEDMKRDFKNAINENVEEVKNATYMAQETLSNSSSI